MAKKKATILFKLLSSVGTGYFYLGKKNSKYNKIKIKKVFVE